MAYACFENAISMWDMRVTMGFIRNYPQITPLAGPYAGGGGWGWVGGYI
jgi:hypothetical protein